MKMFRTMAGVWALVVACVGCASTTTSNQPVGTGGTVSPSQVNSTDRGVVPAGQEMDVRLQTGLSSATATPEQRFEATTAADLMQGDTVLIPAGSTVRGIVSSVEKAGNIDRTGKLTLAFDRIVVRGREYPMRAMAVQVFESGGISEEGKTVGTAGAVGAIVGGILGGLKGALLGAVVGSGGVIAATEGKDVELPPGAIIRIRLDSPVRLR
jgi:hypothetical protein